MSNVRVTNIHENEVEWRSEQEAWNNRSEFFVELHDKQERAAQVTNFIDFLKKHNLLPVPGGRTLDVAAVSVTTPWALPNWGIRLRASIYRMV